MTEEAVTSRVSALSLGQRTYNSISYAGAALVMLLLGEFAGRWHALLALLWIIHFARRTIESLWVHRFSGRLVPPSEYLLEYLYYWGFGIWIALGIASEDYQAISMVRFAGGFGLFFAGQIGNTWAHLKLRRLRLSNGLGGKGLPEGGLFSLVSCPHYSFEITTWAGFALMADVWGAYVFFVVSTAILASYARDRHLAYRREFDGEEGRSRYPASRRALVPFIF